MIRWLRWNLRCHRGRLCGDLLLTEVDENLPSGSTVHMEYICGGCGTTYHRSALVGEGGVFTHDERVRV